MSRPDFELRLFGESAQSGPSAEGSARSSFDGKLSANTDSGKDSGDGTSAVRETPKSIGTDVGEDIENRQTSETEAVTEKPTVETETGGDAKLLAKLLSLMGYEATEGEEALKKLRLNYLRQSIDESISRKNADRAYRKLLSESERLQSKIRGFDLKTELSDRRFSAMVHSGLSLEEAWRAVHFDEIIQSCAAIIKRSAESSVIARLRENRGRPEENGALGQAPSQTKLSVDSLTGKGIRDILRRVENGAKVKF